MSHHGMWHVACLPEKSEFKFFICVHISSVLVNSDKSVRQISEAELDVWLDTKHNFLDDIRSGKV